MPAGFNPLIGGADRATLGCMEGLGRDLLARFQSPHRRGGSRDPLPERPRSVRRNPRFQSPHRRGGSRDRDPRCDADRWVQTGFNPLIGGADRATRRFGVTVTSPSFSSFNPLIGGADRATWRGPVLCPHCRSRCFNPLIGGADRATWCRTGPCQLVCTRKFQSPHRRGGSRDLIVVRTDATIAAAIVSIPS